jgi:hypothetical protein
MEFRKRDIKAEAQKRADAEGVETKPKNKVVKLPDGSYMGKAKTPVPKKKVETTPKAQILGVGSDLDPPNKPQLVDQRFLLVIIESEMFEYGNLRGIEAVGPESCADRNYNQRSRESVFAYKFVDMKDSQALIDYWNNEMGKQNKKVKFTMKTVRVPEMKREEKVEAE